VCDEVVTVESSSMPAEARRATTFLLAALAWSLGLFALVRSPWVEGRLVLPLTQLQKQAADYYSGIPAVPVAVTGECSGTDVLALCLAAIFACPVPWRSRLAGAVGGIALILTLNTVRIATLGHAAASPSLFRILHLQAWPAILVLACAGYVFAWMRDAVGSTGRTEEDEAAGALSPLRRRFVPRAAVLLIAFALAGPWIAQSRSLLGAGAWIARTAAFMLALVGVTARASGNVLTTSRGTFVVTPECLATALIPLSVAGVLAVRTSWPRRAMALAAALPVFALLALARLLLLAVPPVLVASPLFLVHGFHQLVLAVVGVALLAYWREPPAPGRWGRAVARAGAALGAAAILVLVAGGVLTATLTGIARAVAVVAPHTLTALTAPGDAQGALALLPIYQAGLLLALGITVVAGWRCLLSAFGVLLGSQVVLLVVLGALADTEDVVSHALLLRAWAVGVPVVLALWMLHAGEPAAAMTAPLIPAVHAPR
jgi:exosortase/archaeosortase family protein